MTSTNQCVMGIGNKNSSRVLRPPGGGTSFNIFGVMPEEPPAAKSAVTAASLQGGTDTSTEPQPSACSPTDVSTEGLATDEKKEQLEETSSEEVENVGADTGKTADKEEASEHPGDQNATEITENAENRENINCEKTEPVKISDDKKAAEGAADENRNVTSTGTRIKSKGAASTFNPITGEAYDKTKEQVTAQPPPTNVRIRQPPGGQSTKLW